jgi:hypothetical protein
VYTYKYLSFLGLIFSSSQIKINRPPTLPKAFASSLSDYFCQILVSPNLLTDLVSTSAMPKDPV